MTKYILHGGYTRGKSVDNDVFFAEMVKGLPDPVTILGVFFAGEKQRWFELFEESKRRFQEALPSRTLRFIRADDAPDVFIQQLEQSNVVFLRGGNFAPQLVDVLSRIPDLEKRWSRKVIAGSSAGAYALSTYYYSNSRDCCDQGLGILPIKVFCHYNDTKADKLAILKAYKEDLPLYTFAEEKFCIVPK